MKIKKIASAVMGLALATGVSSAYAAAGAEPNSTKGEEAAISLAESLLSIMAAHVTLNGCNTAIYPLTSLNTFPDGSGSATLDGTLNLSVSNVGMTAKGTKYVVAGSGQLRGQGIPDYLGNYAFGVQGAIMAGTATLGLIEFGARNEWGEVIIKDFYTVDGTNGKKLVDDGLEAITKLGYPRSKWKQTSDHTRSNGGDGAWNATKVRVGPTNTPNCKITFTGVFDNISDEHTFVPNTSFIMVSPQ